MARKKTEYTYVEILENALGFRWNRTLFEVHHINHDRSDNSINNLLLIPKKLHRRYHWLVNATMHSREDMFKNTLNIYMTDDESYLHELVSVKSDMAFIMRVQREAIHYREISNTIGEGDFDCADFMNRLSANVMIKYM